MGILGNVGLMEDVSDISISRLIVRQRPFEQAIRNLNLSLTTFKGA